MKKKPSKTDRSFEKDMNARLNELDKFMREAKSDKTSDKSLEARLDALIGVKHMSIKSAKEEFKRACDNLRRELQWPSPTIEGLEKCIEQFKEAKQNALAAVTKSHDPERKVELIYLVKGENRLLGRAQKLLEKGQELEQKGLQLREEKEHKLSQTAKVFFESPKANAAFEVLVKTRYALMKCQASQYKSPEQYEQRLNDFKRAIVNMAYLSDVPQRDQKEALRIAKKQLNFKNEAENTLISLKENKDGKEHRDDYGYR